MTGRRIQLSRTKGFRMPEACLVVARPTPFGNPFRVIDLWSKDPAECLDLFRRWLFGERFDFAARLKFPPAVRRLRTERTKFLAALPLLYAHLDAGGVLGCWCRVDAPCHADVLFDLWRDRWSPEDGGLVV